MIHLPGTPAGTLSPLLDAIVQEVDVRTGLVVWEWHAYGHIPLARLLRHARRTAPPTTPSTSTRSRPLGGGARPDLRARHLGDLRRRPRERPDRRGRSAARRATSGWARAPASGSSTTRGCSPGSRVSMFDDEAGPPQKAPASRGLILTLDSEGASARPSSRQYTRARRHLRPERGQRADACRAANVFVGFGSQPFFSEFTPAGSSLFDASLPVDDGSYRVYRFPWSATPTTTPDVAAQRAGPSARPVYASWNGATDGRALAGAGRARRASLAPVATAPRRGFETRDRRATAPPTRSPCSALDAAGHVARDLAPR